MSIEQGFPFIIVDKFDKEELQRNFNTIILDLNQLLANIRLFSKKINELEKRISTLEE